MQRIDNEIRKTNYTRPIYIKKTTNKNKIAKKYTKKRYENKSNKTREILPNRARQRESQRTRNRES